LPAVNVVIYCVIALVILTIIVSAVAIAATLLKLGRPDPDRSTDESSEPVQRQWAGRSTCEQSPLDEPGACSVNTVSWDTARLLACAHVAEIL